MSGVLSRTVASLTFMIPIPPTRAGFFANARSLLGDVAEEKDVALRRSCCTRRLPAEPRDGALAESPSFDEG